MEPGKQNCAPEESAWQVVPSGQVEPGCEQSNKQILLVPFWTQVPLIAVPAEFLYPAQSVSVVQVFEQNPEGSAAACFIQRRPSLQPFVLVGSEQI